MTSKKGAVQQLQAEINSNEDFEKFMERDGLLVLDVYTEWCGPCIGMIGSLKKIKLELGGDNLQLAVCKADTVDYMARFRNKSEPTWLFASHGKIINSLFGTNVPRLMQMIAEELQNEVKYKNGEFERTFYEWTELTPIEQVIEDKRIAILAEQERIEYEAEEARKKNFVIHVTDKIIQSVPDMGCAFIMPNHAKARDLQKKLSDPTDKSGLVIKDRKFVAIRPEELFTLHFDCPNQLPPEILENLYKNEVLAINFRQSHSEKSVTEMLKDFAKYLTAKQTVYDESENKTTYLSPSLSPYSIPLPDYEGPEYEEGDPDDDVLPPAPPPQSKKLSKSTPPEPSSNGAEVTQITEEKGEALVATQTEPFPGESSTETEETVKEVNNGESQKDDTHVGDENLEEDQPAIKIQRQRIKVENIGGKMHMTVPAVWVPANARTNAALIYLYYRHFTEHFLPPDPIPEPNHLCLVFDAIKRREITEVMDASEPDILAYGFFSNVDSDKPELLAKTTDLYLKRRPCIEDKFVVKAAKRMHSSTILNLAGLGPSYVSLNTEIGREDCLKFFPPSYNAREDEEEGGSENAGGKKKRKGKKKKKPSDGSVLNPDTESTISENVGEEEDDGDDDDDRNSQLSNQTSMDKTSELGVNEK